MVTNERVPVFVIQYLTADREFRQISSNDAKEARVESGTGTFSASFSGFANLDLAATVRVRLGNDGPASRWSISIRNGASLSITDVQFPFVIVPYQLGGQNDSEALLRPLATGRFFQPPKPQDLEPDSPHA